VPLDDQIKPNAQSSHTSNDIHASSAIFYCKIQLIETLTFLAKVDQATIE